jgi:hypothetical protein
MLLLVIGPSLSPFLFVLLPFWQRGRGRTTHFRGRLKAKAGGVQFDYEALGDWLPVDPGVETRQVSLSSEEEGKEGRGKILVLCAVKIERQYDPSLFVQQTQTHKT